MRPPILPDRVRLYVYLIAFAAWALVMGAQAYHAALDRTAPDVVIGAGGVVDWLIGAGLLTAATHTTRATVRHRDDGA